MLFCIKLLIKRLNQEQMIDLSSNIEVK